VNDKDGFVCNAWRSIAYAPEATAHYADWPINESDLHARHIWLVNRRKSLSRRLEGDPMYFDSKVAGFWIWGMCSHIAAGFCSGEGPWKAVVDETGELQLLTDREEGEGVARSMPHLSTEGQCIGRSIVSLGPDRGVNRKFIQLGNNGSGVNRKRVELHHGKGVHMGAFDSNEKMLGWFERLAERLRRVRVTCGDWTRVLGPSVTTRHGITGMVLDPPYENYEEYYSVESSVSADVRKWAIENGDEPLLRIALCGYEGEHEMPSSWECVKWKAQGGYGNQNPDNQNRGLERIWFSPHCLKASLPLFGE